VSPCSGRDRSVLGEWFADNPLLGVAAEKGSFIHWPANLPWASSSHTTGSFSSKLMNNGSAPATPVPTYLTSPSASASVHAPMPQFAGLGSTASSSTEIPTSSSADALPIGAVKIQVHEASLGSIGQRVETDGSQWENRCQFHDFSWKDIALDIIR